MNTKGQEIHLKNKFVTTWKIGLLALLLAGFAPINVYAAVNESCNADLNFGITGTTTPVFLGETFRISAQMGAGAIKGGTYQDIYAFGYALNCHFGEDFATCTSEGNTVEFLGNMTTDCIRPDGTPVELQFPESNVIPITTIGGPIRTAANATCNVQFDARITALDPSPDGDNIVVQAMGWPIKNRPATTCSNGLTSTASSTLGIFVQSCGIQVRKEVSSDGETWVNADRPGRALELLIGDSAFYRLVVKNTSSVNYTEPMRVTDAQVGIDTTVDAIAAGETVILGGGEIGALNVTQACEEVGLVENFASVEGVCRGGNSPVSAIAGNNAFINCTAPSIPRIAIEKSTNGVDADSPTGPEIPVGDAVNWSYKVTNTGQLPLSSIVVTDDQGVTVDCSSQTTLAVGAFMTCTASGTAVAGQYANIGEVNASSDGGPVSDTDPSHYIGMAPGVDIEKYTNGADADTPTGPEIPVGDPVNWSYRVTNTGQLPLSSIVVTDDQGVTVDCSNQTTLAVGAFMTCTASGTAVAGQYANIGEVNASSDGGPVSDTDPSHYIGTSAPNIKILKEIWDGEKFVAADDAASAPVEHWPAGAIYRIIVENTGDVDLENVVINDPTLGIVNYEPKGSGGDGTLAVGEKVTIVSTDLPELAQQSVCAESGDFKNTATADGDAVSDGAGVNDTDDAYLRCVGTPALEVKKYISIDGGTTWVDGTAGPVQWPSGALYKITVKNIGQVKLVNVTITDTMIGGPHAVGTIDVGVTVTILEGDWADLNVATVCENSGTFTNIATAEGTSDELASDTVKETDDAKLECIGPPMISILKKVSLDGVDGTYFDADSAPFPTALYDPQTPVTAHYQITVGNIGNVALTGVVINDTTLGIVNYMPVGLGGAGVLAVAEVVVIDSGDLGALINQDLCDTMGEQANVAFAKGTSAAGVEDEASDPATVDCIGQPAIQILKQVSADGINFEDVSVAADAPSDAWYRITVENTGTVDLENVTVSDSILGLSNVVVTGAGGAGSLAVGEIVVLSHTGGGDNEVTELYVPGMCTTDDVFENTAIADGKSINSTETVDDSDSATFFCAQKLDLCEYGKPAQIKIQYDGDDDTSHSQDPSAVTITPASVNFPPGDVWIEVHDHKDRRMVLAQSFAIGQSAWVFGPRKLISSSYWFRIYTSEGGSLLQTLNFHTSCSEPLNVGDEFGAITILGGLH